MLNPCRSVKDETRRAGECHTVAGRRLENPLQQAPDFSPMVLPSPLGSAAVPDGQGVPNCEHSIGAFLQIRGQRLIFGTHPLKHRLADLPLGALNGNPRH